MLTQRELNYLRQQEAARQQAARQPAAPIQTGQYPPAQQAAGTPSPMQPSWPGYGQGTQPLSPTGGYYPQGQPSNGREYPGTARQEPVYTGGFAPQEPYQGDYAPMQGGYLYEEYADQRQLNTVNAEGKRPKKSKIFGRKADRAAADAPDATPVQESAWPPVAPEEEEAPWEPTPLRQMMLLPCLPSPRPSPWPRRPLPIAFMPCSRQPRRPFRRSLTWPLWSRWSRRSLL